MQDFKQLRVWHLAKDLALAVPESFTARACRSMPGLHRQTVRASASIPANIAEGCAKSSREEFRRYLEISLGSLLEVESHLEVAAGARIVSMETYSQLAAKIALLRRMLISLIKSLRRP
jgi:four helix bundle protein